MGKETSEATRRVVRQAQGNLGGIQLLKRAGGAAPQPDVSQARPMDVSLDQKALTTDTKQRAVTQLTSNNVGSVIGDLRSVAPHQAERADSMLPIEANEVFGELNC